MSSISEIATGIAGLQVASKQANYLKAREEATAEIDWEYRKPRTHLYMAAGLAIFVFACLYLLYPVFGPWLIALVFAHFFMPAVNKVSFWIEVSPKWTLKFVVYELLDFLSCRVPDLLREKTPEIIRKGIFYIMHVPIYILAFFTVFLWAPFSRVAIKAKQGMSLFVIFLAGGISVTLIIYAFVPQLFDSIVTTAPIYLEKIKPWAVELGYGESLTNIQQLIQKGITANPEMTVKAVEVVTKQLGYIFYLIGFVFLTIIYMIGIILNWDKIMKFLNLIFNKLCTPDGSEEAVEKFQKDIGNALTNFAQGKIIVIFIMVFYYMITYGVGGTIFFSQGIPFGIVLSIVTGILCIMPVLGMIFGITIIAIGTFFGLPDAGFTIYLFIIIAGAVGLLFEGKVVDMYFVGKKLEVHGLLVIGAIILGSSLGGLFGMFIATPTLAIGTVVIPMSFYGLIHYKQAKDLYHRERPRLIEKRTVEIMRKALAFTK